MSAWSAARQAWHTALFDPAGCTDCGKAIVNEWTGELRQGTHDRCWAEAWGLDGDRHVLGIPQIPLAQPQELR